MRRKQAHLRYLIKIQIWVNKNRENAFFGQFWIHTKKSYFIYIFKPGQNIMSPQKRIIRILPPLSTDWHPLFFFKGLKFFLGAKMGVPPKILIFLYTLDWVYRPLKLSFIAAFLQNLMKKWSTGVFAPPPHALNRVNPKWPRGLEICQTLGYWIPQTTFAK